MHFMFVINVNTVALVVHFKPFFSFTGLIIPANCVAPLSNKLSTSDQSQQLAVQELQKQQQLHPQSLCHAPNT